MLLEPATGSPPGARRTCSRAARLDLQPRARPRRTGSRSSWPPTRTRRWATRSAQLRRAARRPRRDARAARARAPRSRARTRSRAPRTSRSRRAPATSTCTTSLRELARREPTFALHVHVAVPDAELRRRARSTACARTCRCCSRCRRTRRSGAAATRGLASARTPRLPGLPAHRHPARFGSYADYVEAIDVLLRCGAIPEPTFIWWDVRLQPGLGTLEVRVMDAQTRMRDTAALVALVQCLVRLEAREGMAEEALLDAPEVLDENRFLAARDGMDAQLLDPARDRCVPGGEPAGGAGRRLLAARPRARLRARAGAARPPRRRPRRRAPARDRRRARRRPRRGEGAVRRLLPAALREHAHPAVPA